MLVIIFGDVPGVLNPVYVFFVFCKVCSSDECICVASFYIIWFVDVEVSFGGLDCIWDRNRLDVRPRAVCDSYASNSIQTSSGAHTYYRSLKMLEKYSVHCMALIDTPCYPLYLQEPKKAEN